MPDALKNASTAAMFPDNTKLFRRTNTTEWTTEWTHRIDHRMDPQNCRTTEWTTEWTHRIAGGPRPHLVLVRHLADGIPAHQVQSPIHGTQTRTRVTQYLPVFEKRGWIPGEGTTGANWSGKGYNRNTAWLRDTVRQTSRGKSAAEGRTAGPPQPLTPRGTFAWPYRVTTQ